MRWLALSAAALMAMALAASPAPAQQTHNWTLGDVDSPAHWGPTAARKFAENVDKATSGRVKITVYPVESLFKGKDSLDAVSKNLTQMYRVGGLHTAGEERILELLDLPFFVPADYAFRNKLWDALVPMYRDLMAKRFGVYVADMIQAEPRMIYTKAAFKDLSELKGRKIRTAGPSETEFTRAIGMVPATIMPSEIYTALQQGVIDGNWVADAPHFYNKGYEVTKHIYDVGSGGFTFYVMVNQGALDALGEADRKAVMAELAAYSKDLRKGSEDGYVNGRKWLVDKGMSVVPLAAGDGAAMQKAADQIVENWQKQLDPEQRKLYELARKMIGEYNAAKK
jgi:TRAP-type C4-dicarboxylate transport system substrate-binding protein